MSPTGKRPRLMVTSHECLKDCLIQSGQEQDDLGVIPSLSHFPDPSSSIHSYKLDNDFQVHEVELQLQEALQLKRQRFELAKAKRSQGLSVTLPKLESDSGGVSDLELVLNSLKLLEWPKLEIEPFDRSPEHFTSFFKFVSF